MTNTSPITTSNFLAGVIGVGIALVIMPQIIMGTVGASTDGQNRESANSLIEDINDVCGGNEDSISGELDLDPQYQVVLESDNYIMNKEGEEIDSAKVACSIAGQETLDGGSYTVESSDDNYDISTN